MPTVRPRHVITETEFVSAVLDEAARRWPEDAQRRSKLLLRVLAAGHRALADQQEQVALDRRAAVARTSGSLTGLYGDDYLEALRTDWPA